MDGVTRRPPGAIYDCCAVATEVDLSAALALMARMAATLEKLEATIRDRRGADPAASYVAKLLAKGRPKIAQKLGEEAVETVIAALCDDRQAVIGEAADLLFHLTILLADLDIPLADIFAELDRREGLSGITEKAARKGD